MIATTYAQQILNALFHTGGATGVTPEEELETLTTNLGLTSFTVDGVGTVYGVSADTYFTAFKNNNYAHGGPIAQGYDNLRSKVANSAWYTAKTYSKEFTYMLSSTQKPVQINGWYLDKQDEQDTYYPKDTFLALFTDIKEQDGETIFTEPDPETTTYIRVNLHCDILNGEESLTQASYDSEANETVIMNTNSVIMFPEVVESDEPLLLPWGTIIGFGIYDQETGGKPILWDKLLPDDEGNYISAIKEHVPLFRKGQFKVTLK